LPGADQSNNRLLGVVSRITRATAGDEVVLTLASGLNMVGFAPPGVRLGKGQRAAALVAESAVVLAVGG
jgi:molybdate transport system regulatory protein